MTATITPQEFVQLRAQGKAGPLIDVRNPAEFGEVHAEGAHLVPLDVLDPAAVMASEKPQPDQSLYLICKSGGRSAKACQKFEAAGFANARSIQGGTEAWEKAGLPVVRGKKVVSLERQVRIAAGSLVVLGIALGLLVHPWFLALSGFVGAGLVFSGVTDTCGMGLMLAKMPWNR